MSFPGYWPLCSNTSNETNGGFQCADSRNERTWCWNRFALEVTCTLNPWRVNESTAKNICLAGVKSVTIYDPELATIQDLGTQVSFSKLWYVIVWSDSPSSFSCDLMMSANLVQTSPRLVSQNWTLMFQSEFFQESSAKTFPSMICMTSR